MTDNPTCPECASPMVLRVNSRTGEEFYGCLNYPSCRGTREVNKAQADPDVLPSERVRQNDARRWRRE